MEYTVTTTSFNDEGNLPRFISDMENQTVPPAEIIVADGGSKDGTVELLKTMGNESKIKITVLSGKRLNIAEGFNAAIRAATTLYVFVAGIGNEFAPDCLEFLINATDKGDMIYPPIRGKGTSSFEKEYAKTFLRGDKGKDDKVSLNHGVLLKKQIFDDVGYFYENFVYAGEDSEFYALAAKKGYKPYCVNEAKLYWDVPRNVKELKKQIRVYQIGAMQIYPKELMLKINRRPIAVSIMLIAILILLAILRNVYLTIGVIAAAALYMAKKNWEYGERSYLLDLFNRYYGLICFLKNRKYMGEEYSVKRE